MRERLDAIKICRKILNGHPTVESVYTRLTILSYSKRDNVETNIDTSTLVPKQPFRKILLSG